MIRSFVRSRVRLDCPRQRSFSCQLILLDLSPAQFVRVGLGIGLSNVYPPFHTQDMLTSTCIEINSEEDLIPPGAKPGTIPTDVDQATGIERLELIGKMQGIDIFDMRPLDASRKGIYCTY